MREATVYLTTKPRPPWGSTENMNVTVSAQTLSASYVHSNSPLYAVYPTISALQENVCAIHSVLDRIDALMIPSHANSPIIIGPHLPEIIVCCGREGPETCDSGLARCAVARHCMRGAPDAGHRERGARAGRVDHAAVWAGAR